MNDETSIHHDSSEGSGDGRVRAFGFTFGERPTTDVDRQVREGAYQKLLGNTYIPDQQS
jgi:hypothetical protein